MSFSLFRRVIEKGISRFRSRIGAVGCRNSCRSSFDVERPWLMVPPLFDDSGKVVNKFHIVGSDEEIRYAKRSSGSGGGDIKHVEVVGMSHGWLALYNRASHDTCILNPISGRRIKLPPLPPDSEGGGVLRVALAYSPDRYIRWFAATDIGRAMMIYGGGRKLAFCVPGRSKEWTPCIADAADDDDSCWIPGIERSCIAAGIERREREYEDVIYSRYEKMFYCLTRNPSELESWDVTDRRSPQALRFRATGGTTIDWRSESGKYWLDVDHRGFAWPCRSQQDWELKKMCWRIKYLVPGLDDSELYLVVRHVIPPSSSSSSSSSSYRTVDFDVYAINAVGLKFCYMKASLESMAMLVGTNESRSVCARPYLKPNCIYFTDDSRLMRQSRGGGHDNGIFDYQNNTFSNCCATDNCPLDYPHHIHIKHTTPHPAPPPPPPLWFHYF